jgi:hypothetical protein
VSAGIGLDTTVGDDHRRPGTAANRTWTLKLQCSSGLLEDDVEAIAKSILALFIMIRYCRSELCAGQGLESVDAGGIETRDPSNGPRACWPGGCVDSAVPRAREMSIGGRVRGEKSRSQSVM